jgi:hypothetical protein
MFQKSIEQAAAGIAKYAAKEIELTAHKKVKIADVATAEAAAGGAYLDGTPGEHLDRVLRLQAEVRAIGMAIDTCRARRADAVFEKREADIAALRKRVDGLKQERETLTAKVEKHTKALGELLGIEVGIVATTPGQTSRLQQLQVQAGGLEEKIDRLQGGALPPASMVDLQDSLATADEVAMAVLTDESSCPTAAAVQQWYADCARASHQPFGEHSRRIYLVWTNGEIDYERSYIDVFDFCRPSGALSIHTGQPLLNLASGTFRARKPDPEVAPAARA